MGGLIGEKLEVIQFPHLLWARKNRTCFHRLHVTHLTRPAQEQPVPADGRINVKNVSVEELEGVQPCSPIFSRSAILCCSSPFHSVAVMHNSCICPPGSRVNVTRLRHHQANISIVHKEIP